MYKLEDKEQASFRDFYQAMGLYLIRITAGSYVVPWVFLKKSMPVCSLVSQEMLHSTAYDLFPDHPEQISVPDRELMEHIAENQYFRCFFDDRDISATRIGLRSNDLSAII